jgi:hypothetical protein
MIRSKHPVVWGALFALLVVPALSAFAAEWVKLTSYTVDYKKDKEVVEVGKSEGKFTHVRFEVKNGNLIMEKVKITFHDGETFEPDTKLEFKAGQESRDIDLPGKARIIQKVEFVCHSEKKHEPATLVLYGKEKLESNGRGRAGHPC